MWIKDNDIYVQSLSVQHFITTPATFLNVHFASLLLATWFSQFFYLFSNWLIYYIILICVYLVSDETEHYYSRYVFFGSNFSLT